MHERGSQEKVDDSLCSDEVGNMISPSHDERHGGRGDGDTANDRWRRKDGTFVHPESRALLRAAPWVAHIPVFGEACSAYGLPSVLSLGASYFWLKGLSNQLLNSVTYAMLVVRFGISGTRYQRLSTIGTMGWSLNAFTAMLCDTFSFFGYTKRWYMLISCVLGAVFALIYALLPAKPSSANTAAAFIFLTCFGKANVDILTEGHYSRMMRENPKPGPALVSWIWWASMLGTIVSSAINGPLADAHKQQFAVIISAIIQFLCGIIFVFNWYREKPNRVERLEDAHALLQARLDAERKVAEDTERKRETTEEPKYYDYDDEEGKLNEGVVQDPSVKTKQIKEEEASGVLESTTPTMSYDELRYLEAEDSFEDVPQQPTCLWGAFEINVDVFWRNWKIFVYSCVMTCAVIAMTCGNILADTLGLLIICIVVSVVCCAVSFWALPLVIAKANVFGYLQMTVDVTVWGATVPFFMATKECLPDGPHFSFTFYNTVGPIVGNVAGLVGVAAFNYFFSKHTYRLTFIVTTFINIIGNVFDIVIIKRWNMYIGIPDHAMYLFGNAILYDVCYMIAWMPMIVLISRLCPRGSESMVYAVMAGFRSLGQSTAASIGAIIMEYGWKVSTFPPCDFSKVPWLLFVCRICCPLLIIPLVFLIPNARICDEINVDGHLVEKHLVDVLRERTAKVEPTNEQSFHSNTTGREEVEADGTRYS